MMLRMEAAQAVASPRHTTVLLLALLAIAILEVIQNPISEWPTTLAHSQARVLLYIRILALQSLWVGYVWVGMRHSATSMRGLVDNSRWTVLRWLRYLAIGFAGWVAYLAIGAGLSKVLHPGSEALRGLAAMLPHSLGERTLWVAFAGTAAVCEEIVYRGYLMRQFQALTVNTFIAVVLQGLCYCLVHLALPPQMLVGILILGLLLGGLAVWQKSLVPGMILHVGVGMTALFQPG